MDCVHRHVLEFSKWGRAEVHTTKGARPFSLKRIEGEWVMWALVDPEAKPILQHIYQVKTGESLPVLHSATPINTICLPDGTEWHFFLGVPLGSIGSPKAPHSQGR